MRRPSRPPWEIRASRLGRDGALAAEPGLAGPYDRLGAIRDLELGEDVGDVVAHGLRAENEVARDLLVAPPLRDQLEQLALALGQLGEGLGRARGGEVVE